MGVLIPVEENEEWDEESYTITTTIVVTWKKFRQGTEGSFRRARLVARQYKWPVFPDKAFAPTSVYAIVRLMLHRFLNFFDGCRFGLLDNICDRCVFDGEAARG